MARHRLSSLSTSTTASGVRAVGDSNAGEDAALLGELLTWEHIPSAESLAGVDLASYLKALKEAAASKPRAEWPSPAAFAATASRKPPEDSDDDA
jgi:hypothetical protein